MAVSIYPDYPPPLTLEQREFLLSNVKAWSLLHGLAVRPSTAFISKEVDPSRSLAVTAPVTLFPSLFPQTCFEEARSIQKAYNQLYASIASNEEWLEGVVEEYAFSFKSLWILFRNMGRNRNCKNLISNWPSVVAIFPFSADISENAVQGLFLIFCLQINRSR